MLLRYASAGRIRNIYFRANQAGLHPTAGTIFPQVLFFHKCSIEIDTSGGTPTCREEPGDRSARAPLLTALSFSLREDRGIEVKRVGCVERALLYSVRPEGRDPGSVNDPERRGVVVENLLRLPVELLPLLVVRLGDGGEIRIIEL